MWNRLVSNINWNIHCIQNRIQTNFQNQRNSKIWSSKWIFIYFHHFSFQKIFLVFILISQHKTSAGISRLDIWLYIIVFIIIEQGYLYYFLLNGGRGCTRAPATPRSHKNQGDAEEENHRNHNITWFGHFDYDISSKL